MRECFTHSGSSDLAAAAPRAQVLVDTGELERLREIERLVIAYESAFEAAMNDPRSRELASASAMARLDLFDALASALDGQGKGREE